MRSAGLPVAPVKMEITNEKLECQAATIFLIGLRNGLILNATTTNFSNALESASEIYWSAQCAATYQVLLPPVRFALAFSKRSGFWIGVDAAEKRS